MEPAVVTRELTKKFGDFTAVDRLTIEIRPGEVVGFLGPNGAGKTTAVRMLCGILTPTSGEATVLGYDLIDQTEEIKKRIGYMSQKFSLYEDLTAKENLEFYAGVYGIEPKRRRRKVAEMLAMAELAGRENQLVAGLSRGFRQRLALGCALIADPSLVFLDEPTSGVSPTSRRAFFDIIQGMAAQGTTVIVTTHFMDEAERCNRIAFFSEGMLLAYDSPHNIKREVIKGLLVELRVEQPMGWIDLIKSQPFVEECNVHGSVLHVLLTSEDGLQELYRLTGVKPSPVKPGLEDVFVRLVQSLPPEVSGYCGGEER